MSLIPHEAARKREFSRKAGCRNAFRQAPDCLVDRARRQDRDSLSAAKKFCEVLTHHLLILSKAIVCFWPNAVGHRTG